MWLIWRIDNAGLIVTLATLAQLCHLLFERGETLDKFTAAAIRRFRLGFIVDMQPNVGGEVMRAGTRLRCVPAAWRRVAPLS